MRSRIADVIDPHISKMQFDFRKNRSTVDALYIARRVQDIGEQSGENLVMAMLDWKQAFDKIFHSRMMQALEHLNIPVKIRNIIASLYSSPSFQVKHENIFSQSKPQNAGIRQGCPLSPFLFIFVMIVLFHDIADKHHRVLGACRPEKANFNEITYGPRKAVAEVSNHNEPIGRKSGIQLVRKIRKSMDFTFSCFVLNWLTDWLTD